MQQLVYEKLNSLKLYKITNVLDNYLERAVKEKISIIEALDYLIEIEKIDQDEESLLMRTNVAGFPFRKTKEGFDFSYQPSIKL